jgi:hypothetical protein
VIPPTVNLNGTPGEHLLEQLTEALDALMEAKAALYRAAPHGRDYPRGHDFFVDAQREHIDRLSKLQHLIGDLELLRNNVKEQLDLRQKTKEGR